QLSRTLALQHGGDPRVGAPVELLLTAGSFWHAFVVVPGDDKPGLDGLLIVRRFINRGTSEHPRFESHGADIARPARNPLLDLHPTYLDPDHVVSASLLVQWPGKDEGVA